MIRVQICQRRANPHRDSLAAEVIILRDRLGRLLRRLGTFGLGCALRIINSNQA
jgi:hypothetical protein